MINWWFFSENQDHTNPNWQNRSQVTLEYYSGKPSIKSFYICGFDQIFCLFCIQTNRNTYIFLLKVNNFLWKKTWIWRFSTISRLNWGLRLWHSEKNVFLGSSKFPTFQFFSMNKNSLKKLFRVSLINYKQRWNHLEPSNLLNT